MLCCVTVWSCFMWNIIDKRTQIRHQRAFLLLHNTQKDLAAFPERAFDSKNAHCVDHVVGESERNSFRYIEILSLIEKTVEVNVECFTGTNVL